MTVTLVNETPVILWKIQKTCQRWWENNHTLHEENVGLPRSVRAARISSTSMNLLLYWRIKTRIIHKLYNTLTTHGCVRVAHQSRATRSQVWHRSKKKKTEYNRIRVAQFQQPGSWFLNRVISQLTTDKWILKYSGHSNLIYSLFRTYAAITDRSDYFKKVKKNKNKIQ